MRSTIINTSKELLAYSDFPPSDKYANYMHNSRLLEYFVEYAKHHNLLKYIRFRHRVNEEGALAFMFDVFSLELMNLIF